MLPTGAYTVFAVESGDRLTVLAPPKEGETLPSLKGILVSHVKVPKVGRAGTEDEPCGFDAMDFVRAKCIGKTVHFTALYEVEPLNRTAGRIMLGPSEDLALELISNGLAQVNDRQPVKLDDALVGQYMNAADQAKLHRKGLHSVNAQTKVRPVLPFPPEDIEAFSAAIKGKTIKVRIDRMQSATSAFVSVVDTHQQLLVHFTGVTAIPFNKKDGSGVDPVGAEAKLFTEKLLLNRVVNAQFEGVDAFLNMLVSVVGPKGAFQVEQASRGYVKVNTATLTSTEHREAIRDAEKSAQNKRAGMWKDYVALQAAAVAPGGEGAEAEGAAPSAPRNDFKGAKDFTGTLTQVVSGDMVVVRPNADSGAEPFQYVRLALAGVRVAKPIREHDPKGTETRVTYGEYSWEAKELLRTKFLGKQVQVHVDYTRTSEDTKEVRPSATVIDSQSNINLGAAVVEAGYARFFLGKTDACIAADLLMEAEARAKMRGAGIYGSKASPQVKVVEFSRLGDANGKHILGFLQKGQGGGRAPVLHGVVDMVMNAGAFRVHIPKQHFQISFKLAGIVSPAGGHNGPEDAFYKESRDFAINRVQQRDVDIVVDTSDKGGNFIGKMTVNGKDFATEIVEHGFAAVNNNDRSLLAAEEKARGAKKGIWSSPDTLPERYKAMMLERVDLTAPIAATDRQWKKVTITDVIDANTLTMQSSEASERRKDIDDACKACRDGVAHVSATRGEIVVAKFVDDGSWNRAKVLTVNAKVGEAEILFLDFGTTDTVDLKDIRRIPRENDFEFLRATAPLATVAKLAYIRKLPHTSKYYDDCMDAIWSYGDGAATFVARHEYTAGGNEYYSISTSPAAESLGEYLVKAGVTLIDKKVATVGDKAIYASLQKAQDSACKRRACMWTFGDAGFYDDEDEN